MKARKCGMPQIKITRSTYIEMPSNADRVGIDPKVISTRQLQGRNGADQVHQG